MDTPKQDNPQTLAKAHRLMEWITVILLGTGSIAVTAWFTARPTLFYITSAVCTFLTIPYVVGMMVERSSRSGSYLPVWALLCVIGVLLTHGFLAGLLLGCSFFGIYSMAPLALHEFRLKSELKKRKENEIKLDATRDALYNIVNQDRDIRVGHMSKVYDRLKALSTSLEGNLNELEDLVYDVSRLTEYINTGQWLKDYEADERHEIPNDVNRSVLSQDGLYNLLDDLDDLCDRMIDVSHKLSKEN